MRAGNSRGLQKVNGKMKDEIIRKLIEAKKKFHDAAELMPNDAKIDKWSKKEIFSHVAGWYEEGVLETPRILKGEKPDSFRMSIHGYNKRSIEKRKNKTTKQIIVEMNKLHSKWVKVLKGLDENQITGFYGTCLGKKPINVAWMINEAISHDKSHAQELERKYKR